jgi:hypothetical protein
VAGFIFTTACCFGLLAAEAYRHAELDSAPIPNFGVLHVIAAFLLTPVTQTSDV